MSRNSSSQEVIRIEGARQNNLKNINVEIPLDALTIITGVSGSGKSSLAFDTLYAEGQRRYVESLSAYARQFLERISKPQVGEITGISPAIAIRQKNASRNPRSTVGTVTEIYDYLRVLYARVGNILCRNCSRVVKKDTIDQAVDRILELPTGTRAYLTFPLKGSRLDLSSQDTPKDLALKLTVDNLLKQGFHRVILGEISSSAVVTLSRNRLKSWEDLETVQVLVDRLAVRSNSRDRLVDSLEICFREGNGICQVWPFQGRGNEDFLVNSLYFTERLECQHCDIPYRSPEPRLFSFNNPFGACPTCQGFGNTITLDPDLIIPDSSKTISQTPIEPFTKPRYRRFQRKLEAYAQERKISVDQPFSELPASVRQRIWDGHGDFPGIKGFFRYLERKKYKMHVRILISKYRAYTLCPDCHGERLCQEARDVRLKDLGIGQLTKLQISELQSFFEDLVLRKSQLGVADKLITEIRQRLTFLSKVGLKYLTLDRITSSLSAGEMQRIHLAASLSSTLVGTLYVLDEPSIGLHARDGKRLIEILKELRDLGNTIVVVEHEKEMIETGDYIIDLGPGAGERGGEIIHQGDFPSLLKNKNSLTGNYLTGVQKIPIPVFRRSYDGGTLTVRGARQNNLKNLTVHIPLGVLTCITGVSGSGKSTLVHDILYAGLKRERGEWKDQVGDFDEIEGSEQISEIVLVDQTPIGRTPRSNPITYIKAFDEVRKIFASLRESHSRNLSPGSFSFNIPGGRCETCNGSGTITVEMQFLADAELVCEDCKGTRYKNTVLQVTYKGRNIAEVLRMTVVEALEFFRSRSALVRRLKILDDVGLGYLRLGQPGTTLSGGEAQRIKLAAHLSHKTSGNPLFLLDEPTTGLHFDDIHKLLRALDRLISRGATVIIIEHNLEIVKCADWIIDLGPEGGDAGGDLIAKGTPDKIANCADSHTGRFLKKYLNTN